MADKAEILYEQMLVIRSRLGDEAAFQELTQLHGPRLVLFTKRMLRSCPEEVADVVQETWIAIYRGLPGLLDASKFRQWAFRIARDRIYREFRRRKLPVRSMDELEVADTAQTEEFRLGVDREQLDRCLDALSPEHREALVLRYFEEMDYEEIARTTGCSLGTVRSRIHYGKQALQRIWKETTI